MGEVHGTTEKKEYAKEAERIQMEGEYPNLLAGGACTEGSKTEPLNILPRSQPDLSLLTSICHPSCSSVMTSVRAMLRVSTR